MNGDDVALALHRNFLLLSRRQVSMRKLRPGQEITRALFIVVLLDKFKRQPARSGGVLADDQGIVSVRIEVENQSRRR